MAFFDKLKSGLKSVTDRVTGNYGKLTLELDKGLCLPGDPVKVKVHLESTGELKVTNVVLSLRGTERLSVRKQLDHRTSVEASDSEVSLTQDVVLEATAFELEAGQSRDFEHTFTLPVDLLPSYKGQHLTHQIEVSARADVPWGVDLTAQQDLNVPSRAPHGEHKGRLSVKTDRLLVNVDYHDYVPLGEKLSYTAVYQAQHEVQIRQVLLRARSVETFAARVRTVTQQPQQGGDPSQQGYQQGYQQDSQPGGPQGFQVSFQSGQSPSFQAGPPQSPQQGYDQNLNSRSGHNSHGPDAHEETRTFHEERARTELVLWPSQTLTPGSQAASMGNFEMPAGGGVTYFGRNGSHEVILELEVSLSDGRIMKEETKVVVCGEGQKELEPAS